LTETKKKGKRDQKKRPGEPTTRYLQGRETFLESGAEKAKKGRDFGPGKKTAAGQTGKFAGPLHEGPFE